MTSITCFMRYYIERWFCLVSISAVLLLKQKILTTTSALKTRNWILIINNFCVSLTDYLGFHRYWLNSLWYLWNLRLMYNLVLRALYLLLRTVSLLSRTTCLTATCSTLISNCKLFRFRGISLSYLGLWNLFKITSRRTLTSKVFWLVNLDFPWWGCTFRFGVFTLLWLIMLDELLWNVLLLNRVLLWRTFFGLSLIYL